MTSITELIGGTSGPPIVIDRTVALTREMTAKAYAYWKSVRGARAMPARKDMTLPGMREFLRHIAFVELRPMADGRTAFFVRLAGDKIENVFGSITGKTLNEFLPTALEARWRLVFEAALEARAPVRIASRVVFGGKEYLASEVLMAPLGDGERVTMLFAALDVWPAVGAEPEANGKGA
ncbi:MAG TPA: PAS domain-containing protein [Rhizomicrobium sp.]|jgi:hypothetical protein|nr:PAS domain-containing protein [Rhizomicrobium sp.]